MRSASSASTYPVSSRTLSSRSPTEECSDSSRSRSTIEAKRSSAFTAAGPRPGTSSGTAAISITGSPIVFAWASTRPTVVWPMPRLGEFTTRPKETESPGW